jgi:hypothetical protein
MTAKSKQRQKPLVKSKKDKFLSYGYYISPEIIQKKFILKSDLQLFSMYSNIFHS